MPRKHTKTDSKSTPLPSSLNTRLHRALSERIYLLGPLPSSSPAPPHASLSFLISGQSGKVYTATLPVYPSTESPRCNCPDQLIRKTTCKHILFLSARVLKLPESQLHSPVLTPAQATKFSAQDASLHAAGDAAAPPIIRQMFDEVAGHAVPKHQLSTVPIRQPEGDEECPICYEQFTGENIVYCAFGCGKPVHADCFERYERAVEGEPRCVMCRVPWRQPQGATKLGRRGVLVGRRLVNLADFAPGMFEQGQRGGRRTEPAEEEDRDWELDEEERDQEEEEHDWRPERASKGKVRKKRAQGGGSSANGDRRKRKEAKGARGRGNKVQSGAVGVAKGRVTRAVGSKRGGRNTRTSAKAQRGGGTRSSARLAARNE